jgi:hypothetical protein
MSGKKSVPNREASAGKWIDAGNRSAGRSEDRFTRPSAKQPDLKKKIEHAHMEGESLVAKSKFLGCNRRTERERPETYSTMKI